MAGQPKNLVELLDRAVQVTESRQRVLFGEIVDAVGQGSTGSLLVLAGIITVSPLGGIPGMPSAMGTLVVLVSSQLLVGKARCWLPGWLRRRSLDSRLLSKALRWLYRPARAIDGTLRRRLQMLVTSPSLRFVALACMLIGLSMPLMELVPFSVHSAGAVVSLFGLAVISRDGRPALLAYSLTALTVLLVIRKLL